MYNDLKPSVMIVLALILPATAVWAEPVTTVTLRPSAGQAIEDVPVTFGQVFRKGHIKLGVLVDAGRALVQADVKRRYDDSSVRFAVISLKVPKLDGDLTVAIGDGSGRQAANTPPMRVSDLLRTDFDATVTLAFPDGARRASAVATRPQAAPARTDSRRQATPVLSDSGCSPCWIVCLRAVPSDR
jgi:hypothetical protein